MSKKNENSKGPSLFPNRKAKGYITEVNNLLALELELPLRSIKRVRDTLSMTSAPKILKWYYGAEASLSFKNGKFLLRDFFPDRSSFLKWVYPRNPLLPALTYARFPSTEKKILLKATLEHVNIKFRWMQSRHIHAFAFRPESFEQIKEVAGGEKSFRTKYASLYKKVAINKHKGKRYLHIPNPPLKRVQKALQQLLSPAIEKELDECVFGVGSRGSSQIFQNAAMHASRHLIASFDIADFFPSTTISDVIAGMHELKNRGANMAEWNEEVMHVTMNGEPVPASWFKLSVPDGADTIEGVTFEKNTEIQRMTTPWSDDAILLIGKLGTHRGRLPQGSPLSPLLANVAFMKFDKKIKTSLLDKFGDGFAYTRYFDDLTFSITQHAAKNASIKTEGDFKSLIEQILIDAFKKKKPKKKNSRGKKNSPTKFNSYYQLNNRKSRAHFLAAGHQVTGFTVTKDRVRLTRKKRRELRLISHCLSTQEGIVVSATTWAKSRSDVSYASQTPVWSNSLKGGHRWSQSRGQVFNKRGISLEKLAIQMLRSRMSLRSKITGSKKSVPEIKVKPSQAAHHVLKDLSDVDREKWPTILKDILSYLWIGRFTARLDDKSKNLILIKDESLSGTGDEDVCSVLLEHDASFFLLDISEMSCLVEYWNYLIGNLSFLESCPDDPVFADIHLARNNFKKVIDEYSLEDIEVSSSCIRRKMPPPSDGGGMEVIVPELKFQDRAKELIKISEKYRTLLKLNAMDLPQSKRRLFSQQLNTDEAVDYSSWIEILHEICNVGISMVPRHRNTRFSSSEAGSNNSWFDCVALERLLLKKEVRKASEFDKAKIAYLVLNDFYKLCSDQKYSSKQKFLVDRFIEIFEAFFEKEEQDGREILDSKHSHKYFDRNIWSSDFQSQLIKMVDELECELKKCYVPDLNGKMFLNKPAHLAESIDSISKSPTKYEEWPFVKLDLCLPLNVLIRENINKQLVSEVDIDETFVSADYGKIMDALEEDFGSMQALGVWLDDKEATVGETRAKLKEIGKGRPFIKEIVLQGLDEDVIDRKSLIFGSKVADKRQSIVWRRYIEDNKLIPQHSKDAFECISACRNRVHGEQEDLSALPSRERSKMLKNYRAPHETAAKILGRHWTSVKREEVNYNELELKSADVEILRLLLLSGCIDALQAINRGDFPNSE